MNTLKTLAFAGLGLAALTTVAAIAQDKKPADLPKISKERIDAVIKSSWPNLSADMQARVDQDETMRICSETQNAPSNAQANAITEREKKNMVYPADNKFMGDWKAGEKGALSGYGFRMKDDPKREAGGNCYACHQLAPSEISYGTLGPSLAAYGKLKGNTPAAQKEVYEKIYNTQAFNACSNMPRFGHNKVLSPEQIANYVAFLLDPASPVNK
ncbi:MAG: sulfur oxidation c-type cytochrome SoxX [Beijerinckiaceae bacterium]